MARLGKPLHGPVRLAPGRAHKDEARRVPLQKYVKPPKLPPPKLWPIDCVGPGTVEAEVVVLPPPGVTIVGFAKATTPPSQGSNTGTSLVIPVPTGVQDGGILLAMTERQTAGITPPAGWSLLVSNSSMRIYQRTASAEPSSYTWVLSQANRGRSGVMLAIRGGTVGNASGVYITAPDPAICPDVAAGAAAGALWLGFVSCIDSGDNVEGISVAGAHALLVQHSGGGTFAGPPFDVCACAVSTQADLLADQVVGSGNSFADISNTADRCTASIIINPA